MFFIKYKKILITFIIILLINILSLLLIQSIVFSETINIQKYVENNFPPIFSFYLESLGDLDEYELEFLEILQNMSEDKQEYYAKIVFKEGFSLDLLNEIKYVSEPQDEPLKDKEVIWDNYEKKETNEVDVREKSIAQIVKEIENSVVRIDVYNSQNDFVTQGTGFFIDKDKIITNYHVIENASNIEIKLNSGEYYTVISIEDKDEICDIAILSVNVCGYNYKPLELTYKLPDMGERVVVYGCPEGLDRTVSDGIVSSIRNIPEFGKIIQITAPVSQGSSGSPILNLKGEVVGIATFVWSSGQNLNFAISSEKILDTIISENKSKLELEVDYSDLLKANADEVYQIGVEYSELQLYEEALKLFNLAINKENDHVYAYYYAGWVCMQLERYNEAISYFRRTLDIDEDLYEVYHYLGFSYWALDQIENAIFSFKNLLNNDCQFKRIETLHALGLLFDGIRDYKNAIKCYEEYLIYDSSNKDIYYNLGYAYSEIGVEEKGSISKDCYFKAIDAFNRCLQIDPFYVDAYFSLAVNYIRLNNFPLAYSAFQEVVHIDPQNADAYYRMGLISLLCKNPNLAIDAYHNLQILDTNLALDLYKKIQEFYKYY